MNAVLSWMLDPLFLFVPSLKDYSWALQGLLILLFTGFVGILVNSILAKIVRALGEGHPRWSELVIDGVRRPLSVLVWVVGITLSLEIAAKALDDITLDEAEHFRSISYTLLLAWALIRLVSRIEVRLVKGEANKPGMDRTTADAIAKLVRLTILVMAALALLQNLGVSISGILAFGGVGGLAVGFAAKDLLANFFGGLMIYMDRPFKVGDWIRSPDKEIEGTVEEIGWRLTRIRTFDKRPLYVPNSTFANIAVENPSRMTNRRIYENIGIRYDDAAQAREIVAGIKAMLEQHPDIDQQQTLIVNLNHFGPSSLDILVYTFTKTTVWVEYHGIKQDVLLKIMDVISANGAEVAFPTSTLHLASMPDRVETETSAR
ncbi:MAG TPA: mechanosensitive ion channel family protein [Marinobacterium sp.]|nr:mechanosensitive ion channel family protein [Marinobacterium sp.]